MNAHAIFDDLQGPRVARVAEHEQATRDGGRGGPCLQHVQHPVHRAREPGPDEIEQGGREVHRGDEAVDAAARDPGAATDDRDPHRLPVEVRVPAAESVLPELLAVVRDDAYEEASPEAERADLPDQPLDLGVDEPDLRIVGLDAVAVVGAEGRPS